MSEQKETRNRTSANGEGSCKYIESKKLWCARITTGWEVVNGKRKQIRPAFYGKTKKEALDQATEAKARVLQGKAAVSSGMKLSDWSDRWMSDYKSAPASRTIAQYAGVIKNQIKPAIGDFKLKDLRQSHVQKMINETVSLRRENEIARRIRLYYHKSPEPITFEVRGSGLFM